MVHLGTQNSPKLAKIFYCNFCDYSCAKKNDFDKHLSTQKHRNATNGTQMVQNGTQNSQKSQELFSCICGKKYKYKQGLYRHHKNCKLMIDNEEIKEDSNEFKKLVVKLINDNSEMKNIIIKQQEQIGELIPKIGNTTNNNSLTKNKFNINVFLNEKCKDALSLDKFIDNIQISIKDLLTTKDKGNIEGISNIIMENMNKLSLYERPLHCTDLKRETLYIKNKNEWEKDNNKCGINNAIKKVENKQLKNIQSWLDEHPNWENNSKEQEEYMKLIKHCTTT